MIDEDAKTLWCGNLSDQVTEELLYELFLQAGPLEKVRIPRDRDGSQRNFSFITFCHEVSVPYAINLLKGTALFNRTLTLQSRTQTASLPPPIRCSSDQSIEFPIHANIHNQFAEMADNFVRNHSFPPSNGEPDRLSVASLQGNWSHRHHPYRKEEREGGYGRHRGREEREGGKRHRGGHQPWEHNPWEHNPRHIESRRDGRDRHRNYGGNNSRRNK